MLLFGVAFIALNVHVRNRRSESHQQKYPKSATLTYANVASSGLRNQYRELQNYHCKNCGHKRINKEYIKTDCGKKPTYLISGKLAFYQDYLLAI